jgi:hypothetical protein
MISGILTALSLLAIDPGSPEFDAWLKGLSEAAPTELAFVESRDSGLLAEPLEVHGRLARDGDRLVRRTESPRRETQTLSASAIELRRDDGYRQRFAIRRAPELAALREALLAVLDGNAVRLAEHFEVSLEFDEQDSWRLTLDPRDPDLAERVAGLTIGGSEQTLDWLELTLGDGEQILTRFDHAP